MPPRGAGRVVDDTDVAVGQGLGEGQPVRPGAHVDEGLADAVASLGRSWTAAAGSSGRWTTTSLAASNGASIAAAGRARMLAVPNRSTQASDDAPVRQDRGMARLVGEPEVLGRPERSRSAVGC